MKVRVITRKSVPKVIQVLNDRGVVREVYPLECVFAAGGAHAEYQYSADSTELHVVCQSGWPDKVMYGYGMESQEVEAEFVEYQDFHPELFYDKATPTLRVFSTKEELENFATNNGGLVVCGQLRGGKACDVVYAGKGKLFLFKDWAVLSTEEFGDRAYYNWKRFTKMDAIEDYMKYVKSGKVPRYFNKGGIADEE